MRSSRTVAKARSSRARPGATGASPEDELSFDDAHAPFTTEPPTEEEALPPSDASGGPDVDAANVAAETRTARRSLRGDASASSLLAGASSFVVAFFVVLSYAWLKPDAGASTLRATRSHKSAAVAAGTPLSFRVRNAYVDAYGEPGTLYSWASSSRAFSVGQGPMASFDLRGEMMTMVRRRDERSAKSARERRRQFAGGLPSLCSDLEASMSPGCTDA